MNKKYLCIDLKTFYASVECVERNLDPFQTDLVVADPSRNKGTICLAISPKMKSRGIRNRCRIYEIPSGIKYIIAKPRMKKYIEYSANIYAIYLKYVDKTDIHVYSIDEAFLDVTNYLTFYRMNEVELAKTIMNDILKTTGITATVGIGTNLYLSKIALDITAKHNKNHIGYLDEEIYRRELWHHTPLRDFWQIGRGIEERLHRLGIHTMYEIAQCDENKLYKEFGINAKLLIDHSKGIEPVTIKEIKEYKRKNTSISNSQILMKDYDAGNARKILVEMVDATCMELVTKELCATSIHFFIGYSKDQIRPLSISKRLEQPTNSYTKLLDIILREYDRYINREIPIRRIGISYGGLVNKREHQLDLFSNPMEEKIDSKIESVMSGIKNKFGKNAILRGVSYEEGSTQRDRNRLVGGHNAE